MSKPETLANADSHTGSVSVVPGGAVIGTIRPPGSKSLTNRALVCAAFAQGRSTLSGALFSEDTEVMTEALRAIGVEISPTRGRRTLAVDPGKRQSSESTLDLFMANSGTTIRFLTAALSAAGGHYRLHGVARMHQRPIGDLIESIEPVIDGSIRTESPNGCPPVRIDSHGWRRGDLQVAGSVSSQFLSGLMMAAPISGKRTSIVVSGELVSRPYVEMTADVMRSFGAAVNTYPGHPSHGEALRFDCAANGYRGTDYAIEPDASAASYFWAAAAITGGRVTVEGLSREALQGDVGFCDVLEAMGCEVIAAPDSLTVIGKKLRGIDIDMNAISDTVQTLAVVALFADGPTRVRGVAHNRFKETDRIGDLSRELRKLGAEVMEHEDGLTITPPKSVRGGLRGATIETYHDHRMAMSLSLAGLRIAGVRIVNPACTSKTYPDFFADLERLIGRAHDWVADPHHD